MRPGEKGDHVNLCECACSPTGVREGAHTQAGPRQLHQDTEEVHREICQLRDNACPTPRPQDPVSMEKVWILEVFRKKEGDAGNERDEDMNQVNKCKDRKSAACGDSIDLNSIHNDRKCEEIARKERIQ